MKSTAQYTILLMTQRFAGLLLIPVYLEFFSVYEYGYFSLMNSLKAFFAIFCTLNLESAVLTYFFNFKNNSLGLREYLRNIFTLAIYFGIVIILVFTIFGDQLFGLVFSDQSVEFYPSGLVIVCTAASSSINQIFFVYLRNGEAIAEYSKLTIVSLLLSILLQLFLIIILKQGFFGALLGMLISNSLITLIIIVLNPWLIGVRISRSVVNSSVVYCLGLIPFLIIQWVLSLGDRVLVERLFTLELVGQYSLMMSIAMVLSLSSNSYLMAIRPGLYEILNESEIRINKLVGLFTPYLGLLILVSVMIYLSVLLLSTYFEQSGYKYIRELILSGIGLFFVRSLIRFFNEFLFHQKRSAELSWLSFVNVITLAILLFTFLDQMTIRAFLYILITSNFILLILTIVRTKFLISNNWKSFYEA